MKRTIFALGLMVIGFCATAQITTYRGGNSYNRTTNGNNGMQNNYTQNSRQVNTNGVNNNFNSISEGKASYFARSFSWYTPTDTHAYGLNPVDGRNNVRLPLEADAVMMMQIVGGIRAVIIAKGTLCRFRIVNGQTCQTPYALDACGNTIYEMEYVVNDQQPVFAENPCINCPPVADPCINCPPAVSPEAYYNMNNYSNRRQSTYIPPQPLVVYNDNPHKGWPTWAKVLVPAIVVGTASYFIFKKSPSEPTDQEVITLPATSAMRLNPGIGGGFVIHF